ncbi:protein kinase domain-containing protein [Nostoc sp. 'Peltigera membranacea cyanobiont' 232]|uniref:protein kinase domain-containing protein n=1 Tax=Nostoc sp. 'Peltigera membranacea cyanobiont' 232 TaxID=2014531 RepID=UPI000B9594EF|nr:protein kinase [Nostoc sp. 'Peltigera membranacea cyanobiont' 232]OYE04592.1 hypothetical protein CDG79_12530 [Nostoc sp. 'Peltigera membranacea cyanobiont' 232]
MPQNFAQWKVGDIILDLYKVTDILGEGGFGKVYKVRHQGWNIDLAVKSPKPEIVEAAGGVENFEREAETWVNLGLHPHTVSCYYVRRIDRSPVVFAEYVAGGSLSDWIYSRSLYAGGTETSLKRILDIAIQFAWGLHYAHQQGLIHQDVKPANVMMTAEGVVKVTDFGLANQRTLSVIANDQERQVQTITISEVTLMVAGSGAMTPAYCSPEQANGNNLTRRTDLWSWALSVLEMFQGELTWRHGTVAAGVLEYYLESGSEYLQLPQMPILFAQLLRRCFRENPDERPHDMLEVANELQEIYQQVTGEVYPQQHPQTGKDIADSLNNRAVSLFDLGKQEEALQLWEQALQVHPQHPESTFNRGLVLWRSRGINDDTLVEALNDAQRSHPGDWNVKYFLSLVHLERDDCKAAIEILESIQEQEAQKEEVRAALALARERLPHSRRLLNSFKIDTNDIKSVCMSADGQFALSGSGSNLKLWDIRTGECVRIFEGHTGSVNSVCLSADNQFALSGSSDETLKLWDIRTGECVRAFEGHTDSVNSVCINQYAYAVSGSSDKTLKLWDIRTGECVRTFEGHTDSVNSVYLSSRGLILSGSSDKTLKLWYSWRTGKCVHTFEGHTGSVNSVYLSANDTLALSGSSDKTLKLWEVRTVRCVRTFEGYIGCLSADIAVSITAHTSIGYRKLKLWEIATGLCLYTFEGHISRYGVWSVCVSADNQFALCWHGKEIRIWAVNCQKNAYLAPMVLSRILDTQTNLSLNQTYTQGLKAAQMALDRHDYIAAAQHIRKVRSLRGYNRALEALNIWKKLYVRLPCKTFLNVWNTLTFEGHTDSISSVCLSADSQFALSGSSDKTLKLWEVATGRCLRTFEGHKKYVQSVYLSADNQFVLSGSDDDTLKLWEVATGVCLRTFEGHRRGSVQLVCLSTDNKFALSGGYDRTLKLWEVSTGRCLHTFEGHTDVVYSVCLSADNQFALSGSRDKTLKLWVLSAGHCLRTFEGHTDGVNSVCLSADNQFALSGSSDKTLKLWEVATGNCLRTFEGHTDRVNSVCLTADNKFAISASQDGTLKLWQISTGLCLRTIEEGTDNVYSLALSTDNYFALTGSGDKTLKLWILDWELQDQPLAEWEGIVPYLQNFLTLHAPYATSLPKNRQPSEEEIGLALTHYGIPTWSKEDFQNLLYTLGCVGYGWLRPETVQQVLERIVTHWKRRNLLNLVHFQISIKIKKIRYDLQASTKIRKIRHVLLIIYFQTFTQIKKIKIVRLLIDFLK